MDSSPHSATDAPQPSTDALTVAHELVQGFERVGLKLCKTLVNMLNELPEHRTERRGCGYTQATRFLSSLICKSADATSAAGSLFHPDIEREPRATLRAHVARVTPALLSCLKREESVLLAELILSIAERTGVGRFVTAPAPEKLPIGTCPLAEEYFLEIAYGRIRRGGRIHLYLDDDGLPLLIEKCQLGEKHSSISLAPLVINDVAIPVGSLIGIDRPEIDAEAYPTTRSGRGLALPKRVLRQVCFLRFTTLAVSPVARARAFSSHFEQQVRGGLFSPRDTTMAQMIAFVGSELAGGA